MEIKDYVILIVGIVSLLLVASTVFGFDLNRLNPTVEKVRVELTGEVKCGLGFCHFTKNINLDVRKNAGPLSVFQDKKLAWYCGPLGEAKDLEAELIVTTPDGSVERFSDEKGTCKAEDVTFDWIIPLDSGKGQYDVQGRVCGDTNFGWRCVKETTTFYGGG